jgi:hypothetical protein
MTRNCTTQCRHCLAVLYAVVAFVVSGCASDEGQGIVRGNVTLDGQPLESGVIRFVPVDGQSPTADATVTNGEFSATVPLGDKRVEITAPKVVGKKQMYATPDSPTVDVVEELLPQRYNIRTELAFTVTTGDQEKDFALHSGQ